MKLQDSELSALYDGELDTHESRSAIATTLGCTRSRNDWHTYALIGDHLRQEGCVRADITAAVMARLQAEPVVLAPRQMGLAHRHHPFWALAASVTGIAVVGWLAFAGLPGGEIRIVSVPPASTIAMSSTAAPVGIHASQDARSNDVREYMLAHHTHAATFRLGDSTDHVRTVVMATPAVRP